MLIYDNNNNKVLILIFFTYEYCTLV
jgi:hypothetical protein